MLRTSKRLAGQTNGPSPKKSKSSHESQDSKKVTKPSPFPKWSKKLKNVHIVDKEWVVGYSTSLEEAQETIDAHSRSLMCDYLKSHPGSGTNCKKAKADSRLLWHSKQIPFDGTPFSVASYHHYKCAYSFRSKTKKLDDEEGIKSASEPVSDDTNGKYTCCPAKLTMKEIIKYPSACVALTASKQQKLASLKKLKEDLKNKDKLPTESRFIVSLPMPCVHNHQFWGKYRVLSKDVRKTIKQLHENGMTSPKKIKQNIEKKVNQDFANKLCPPSKEDQSYYPSLKTIYCVINGRKPSIKKAPSPKPDEFQPATLEEAVAIFCTDDYTSESYESELLSKITDKLESLKKLSQSVSDSQSLTELYNTLCVLCDQYSGKAFANGVVIGVPETVFLSDSISDDSSSQIASDFVSPDGVPCSTIESTSEDQMDLLRQQIMLGHDPT